MSRTAESLLELVKGPLTMTDGGPVRPRQLGKMECQGSAINNLAADRPRNVNGGVEQAGENVQFRQDGLFVCLKNMFFPPRRIKIEQQGDWVPKTWLRVQSETGTKAHKSKFGGKFLKKSIHEELRKSLSLTYSRVPGQRGIWMRPRTSHPV